MADIVSPSKRSQMMAGIRAKNTKPELIVRSALHARGERYRLHDERLPGKPDLVFPKYKAVVFVNGCFWHFHGCHLSKLPASRQKFWLPKLSATVERDAKRSKSLLDNGWSVAIVWECALTGKLKLPLEEVISDLQTWLRSGGATIEFVGS